MLFISITTWAQHRDYNITLHSVVDTLSFVHQDSSSLRYPGSRSGMSHIYTKLANLMKTGKGRVNILHIGGSHVQAGILSNEIRMNLVNAQDNGNRWGGADRGVIFPFSVMKTDTPEDYLIISTGKWRRSRCISQTLDADLGIAGAALMTTDPSASLSVDMKNKQWAFSRLRILGEATSGDIYPVVIAGTDTLMPSRATDGIGYLFTMPHEVTKCTIAFHGLLDGTKAEPSTAMFTLRGMLPMSNRNGITYTASGINGAAVPSWLKCIHLEEELSLLPPDLVIFGIGINDACKSEADFSPETFKANYHKLISKIRHLNPQCSFIFITNNDSYYNKKLNPNTPRANQVFYDLAREYDSAVFDVYEIMGGYGSCEEWVKHGYMWGDHVHFKKNGYQLLGDLLSNAIITDFCKQN